MIHYLKIARLDHWIKNLFALPGFFFAIMFEGELHYQQVQTFTIAFISLCLASSANYTINEWLDRHSDQNHPIKFTRPAAQGKVKFPNVLIQYILLSLTSAWISYFLGFKYLILISIFLLLGVAYNVSPIRTKDRVFIDIVTESANNPIRFLFGWYAVISTFPPSSALFGYWCAGAFLMTLKRYGEKKQLTSDHNVSVAQIAQYRISLATYTQEQLFSMGIFFAILSASLFGIFLSKYSQMMFIAIPSVAMCFIEYFRLAELPNSPVQHPELLYKERRLLFWAASVVILSGIAMGVSS